MPIVIISGQPSSGKTTIANALRNNAISNGRGALMVDENSDAELRYLLEKILDGVVLRPGVPAAEQKWKPNCTVVLVGDRAYETLADFEILAPGFAQLHGPHYSVSTGIL
jgi:hypothetical protein